MCDTFREAMEMSEKLSFVEAQINQQSHAVDLMLEM